MQIDSEAHLTYCSNIHPAETWLDTFQNIKSYTLTIKKRLNRKLFGVGLRLSNRASLELLEGCKLDLFKNWLLENDLYVFTVNGFPYGQFHGTKVKDAVHLPDWSTRERLDYTKRLFTILAGLLPQGMDGGVSTSPITYKHWHSTDQLVQVKKTAVKQLVALIVFLAQLKRETGKNLHLDMEPEPDGLLETSGEFIGFFDRIINEGAVQVALELGIDKSTAGKVIQDHFQLCLDVCHFAVGFEVPSEVIRSISAAGIGIGRIQISAALGSQNMVGKENIEKVRQEMRLFNEPTYLHQAVISSTNGIRRYKDLGPALDSLMEGDEEIRTHFHVPVFTGNYNGLLSTQKDIIDTLDIWKKNRFTQHLEVETYTWEVLPKNLRTSLVDSIVRELKWVEKYLKI